MNTYDFDKTVYRRDSSVDFWLYCLKTYPRAILPVLPGSILAGIRYRFRRLSTKDLKECLFSFLPRIDAREAVEAFWKEHQDGIVEWYLSQKRSDDLIISASPEFLLRPIAIQLGVRLIATPMDPLTGKIRGLNCHDVEKVRRFQEECHGLSVEEFYSDSLSDTPMALIAKRAYLVKGNSRYPWPDHTFQEN